MLLTPSAVTLDRRESHVYARASRGRDDPPPARRCAWSGGAIDSAMGIRVPQVHRCAPGRGLRRSTTSVVAGNTCVVGLDDDRELVVHLGMTGSLRVRPDDEIATGDPYVRAAGSSTRRTSLVFRDVRRFGRIAVVPSGAYRSPPDARGPRPRALRRRRSPRRTCTAAAIAADRRIKTQLLSQRPSPASATSTRTRRCGSRVCTLGRDRSPGSRPELLAAIRDVLAAGISNGGTTLRDYVDSEGHPGDNQNHLRCYGQAGRPCQRCGTALIRRSIDARTSTFCPNCQRNR